MQKTKIDWCTHTWNPCVGCSLPLVSKGCENCYARKLHNGRHRAYKAGKKLPEQYAKPFEKIQLFPNRLDDPLKCRAKNARIFVGSMSDLFHPKVPFEFILKVIGVTIATPWHTHLVLTKHPDRMYDFFACWPDGWFIREGMKHSSFSNEFFAIDSIKGLLTKKNLKKANDFWKSNYDQSKRGKLDGPVPFPQPNVHLGVSISNQAEADEKIPILLQIPAAVRWLSIEPMLGNVDLENVTMELPSGALVRGTVLGSDGRHFTPGGAKGIGIDWVVVGGESGPGARYCPIENIRSVVRQCKAASVPVFVKQVHLNGKAKAIHDINQFPEDLRIRELPNV